MSRLVSAGALVLAALTHSSIVDGGTIMLSPSSATATNQFSATYAVGNTINGSGLPVNFTPASTHGNYASPTFGANNYWTTGFSANSQGHTKAQITAGTLSATYTFAVVQDMRGLYLWNHQGSAGSSRYYVTSFDLVFRDVSNAIIATYLGLTAGDPTIAPISQKAENITFSDVYDVKTVQFVIRSTRGTDQNIPGHVPSSTYYAGLAEIAFQVYVPEPASASVWATALAWSLRRPKRRLKG